MGETGQWGGRVVPSPDPTSRARQAPAAQQLPTGFRARFTPGIHSGVARNAVRRRHLGWHHAGSLTSSELPPWPGPPWALPREGEDMGLQREPFASGSWAGWSLRVPSNLRHSMILSLWSLGITEPWNGLGGKGLLKAIWSSAAATSRDIFTQIRLLRAPSTLAWNVSSDRASTTSLGNLY